MDRGPGGYVAFRGGDFECELSRRGREKREEGESRTDLEFFLVLSLRVGMCAVLASFLCLQDVRILYVVALERGWADPHRAKSLFLSLLLLSFFLPP